MVSYVSGEETRLHGFWGIDVSHISYIYFELLVAEDTTECRLGVIFVTWFIFKLSCYVNFLRYCFVLIVAHDIRHMGRKMISWIWVVCDVTMTSDFYDHI